MAGATALADDLLLHLPQVPLMSLLLLAFHAVTVAIVVSQGLVAL
jgi:hypothetical protein